MKAKAIILMSIYLIFESVYLIFGDNQNDYWSCFSFFSQAFFIAGIVLILRDYINNVMLSLVVGAQIVKITYNFVFFVDKEWAQTININRYFILTLCTSLITYLLIKLPEKNDWKRH